MITKKNDTLAQLSEIYFVSFWQEAPVYTELNRENEEEKGNQFLKHAVF